MAEESDAVIVLPGAGGADDESRAPDVLLEGLVRVAPPCLGLASVKRV